MQESVGNDGVNANALTEEQMQMVNPDKTPAALPPEGQTMCIYDLKIQMRLF